MASIFAQNLNIFRVKDLEQKEMETGLLLNPNLLSSGWKERGRKQDAS